MGDVAHSDLQNESPTEVKCSSKKVAPLENGKKSEQQDENTLVNSRVARLSICEGNGITEDIILSLKSKEKVDQDADLTNGSTDSQGKRTKTSKRRRRSSAAVPGPGKLKPAPKHSTSGTIQVKKKKKILKPLLEVRDRPDRKINVRELRDLVVYAMDGNNNAPKWVTIENRSAIQKVIVLLVPGLQVEDFDLPKGSKFSESKEQLREAHLKGLNDPTLMKELQAFPVSAPGSNTSLFSAYNSFVNVQLSKNEKKKRREELENKKITINDLLMNVDDLIENDYPIHMETAGLTDELRNELTQRYEEQAVKYLPTLSFEHEGSHIFALDCEMCRAEEGLVLARVSIVNFNLEVVYDKLVKPSVPIIDYMTRYSGITEEKLSDVTTTLQDVQQDILKIVSTEDILIGHSLQSDFDVLQMRHPKVVDTAAIFDHKAGPPFRPALRYLASTFLNDDIQNDNGLGHDSIEDATACMKLVKAKIANGMGFGLTINTENLFNKLSRVGVKSMRLSDTGPKLHVAGTNHLESAIRCRSDREIMSVMTENLNKYDLFVCRLRGLEFGRGYATPSALRPCEVPSPEDALEFFSASLQEVYSKCCSGTMIMVMSGSGDTRQWSGIMKELNDLDKEVRAEERQKLQKEIEDAVEVARDGVGFIILKQNGPVE